MDNIAHTLAGLATRDVAPKPLFKSKSFFWVTLAIANIPDIDIFAWFINQEFYFHIHRGITHSVFLIPFWGLLGAVSVYFISKKTVSFLDAWLWFSIIIVVHITLDWVTSYGTALFAPLTDEPYSAHLFPIVDIWVLLPLIILLAIGRYFSYCRRKIAVVVIAFLLVYAGFRFTMKSRAEGLIIEQYGVPEEIESFANLESWRVWLNPSLYRVVTVRGDSAVSYEIAPLSKRIAEQGRYDIFDSTDAYWDEVLEFTLSRDFILRSDLPIHDFRNDSLLVSDLRYTSDLSNNSSLTIYFPVRKGKISGSPRFLRPEIEIR